MIFTTILSITFPSVLSSTIGRCLIRGGVLRLGGLLPFSPRERGERGEPARRGERGKHTRRGRRGEQARQGAQAGREEKAPSGRTGRTYPSGIASPDEPE